MSAEEDKKATEPGSEEKEPVVMGAADGADSVEKGETPLEEQAVLAEGTKEDASADKASSESHEKAEAGGSKEEALGEASATPPGEPDSGDEEKPEMKWYVVHTYSGHENKVRENIIKMISTSSIENQFGKLIVPTEEVAEMKKGKKTITTRKFFPSYILIEMHMTDESWHLVNSIPGVTSFVGTGRTPQPLSRQEVERILGRMDREKQTITPEIPFTLGEHIRIKDGPFSDFTGVIDEVNAEKGKLKVLVSIFGRETPVELDFLQVESL